MDFSKIINAVLVAAAIAAAQGLASEMTPRKKR